ALLLKYLRVCVHTTVADATRGQQWLARLEAETAPGAPTLGHAGDPQAGTQGLWQVLVGELPGEDERVLFTLLFVRGLSAQAVCSQEPHLFPDKEAVYRGKALIFERLRTSEHLQAIFGPPFKGMSPDQ